MTGGLRAGGPVRAYRILTPTGFFDSSPLIDLESMGTSSLMIVSSKSILTKDGSPSGQTKSEKIASLKREISVLEQEDIPKPPKKFSLNHTEHVMKANIEDNIHEDKQAKSLSKALVKPGKGRLPFGSSLEQIVLQVPAQIMSRTRMMPPMNRGGGSQALWTVHGVTLKRPTKYNGTSDADAYQCFVREGSAYVKAGQVPVDKQPFHLSYFLMDHASKFYNDKVAKAEWFGLFLNSSGDYLTSASQQISKTSREIECEPKVDAEAFQHMDAAVEGTLSPRERYFELLWLELPTPGLNLLLLKRRTCPSTLRRTASKPWMERKLSPQKKNELMAVGLCLNCEQVGHLACNCPELTTMKFEQKGKPPGFGTHAVDFSGYAVLFKTTEVIETLHVGSAFVGVRADEGEGTTNNNFDSLPSELHPQQPIGDLIAQYAEIILQLAQLHHGVMVFSSLLSDNDSDMPDSQSVEVSDSESEKPEPMLMFDVQDETFEDRIEKIRLTFETLELHEDHEWILPKQSCKAIVHGTRQSFDEISRELSEFSTYNIQCVVPDNGETVPDMFLVTRLDDDGGLKLNVLTTKLLENPLLDLVGWLRKQDQWKTLKKNEILNGFESVNEFSFCYSLTEHHISEEEYRLLADLRRVDLVREKMVNGSHHR
ncbi:hypothetical protein C8J57DRAFT_1219532 [Mycena rebaudengoi]|nr:hypothetical protein C8J57DRAFT_1219532 [Mycena rebaudengoi]